MNLRVIAIGLAVLSAPSSVAKATPPCVATAEVEPQKAVVGQQVIWNVRIDSRDDVAEISWIDTPSFADMRTERLPGVPTLAPSETLPSSRYTSRQERRSLFAERAGELPVTTSGFHCKLVGGDVLTTPVPTVTLHVSSPSEHDRPADFSGAIGPLVMQAHVEPHELLLGETLHVTVSIRGAGNVWDVADPLADWSPQDADVFAAPATIELRRGSQLSVQKIFRYDVVPRTVGPFPVPPIHFSYFDPVGHRYAVAQSLRQEVAVRAQQSPEPVEAVSREPRVRPPDGDRENPERRWLVGAVAVGLVAGILAVWRARRADKAGSGSSPVLTGDADRDAAELARALRSAIADSEPSPDQRDAIAVLDQLERSRFDPKTHAPEQTQIDDALAKLRA